MFGIRFVRVMLTASIMTLGIGGATLVLTAPSGGAVTVATSTGPQCTFNGSSTPLLTGVSAGSKIAVSCTGLPALHPYMLVGTSLVLPLDPAAAPLFSGQVASLAGLMSLLAALKEIDLASARDSHLERLWGLEHDLDGADLSGARPERLLPSNARRIQFGPARMCLGNDRPR